MNYRDIIKQKAKDIFSSLAKTASGKLTGSQLPPNAIIIQKEEIPVKSDATEGPGTTETAYIFRRANQHGQIFHIPLNAPDGVNPAAMAKIRELGLEKERFFFQMGHSDSFVEATSRLVGEPIHADW